ncbi:MAG: ribonuclease P protein component [Cohaesibacteraceae bacterium]|nr:ribonuclease P protein component [Cohaesibacteraceae bacterium]
MTCSSPTIRLKKRGEFLAVAKGLRVPRRGFVLQAIKTTQATGTPRIGYTVTKKTGNSPQRNRIKRRLRAVVADLGKAHMHIGYDYVLIGRHAALSLPYERLLSDFMAGMKLAHDPDYKSPPPRFRKGQGGKQKSNRPSSGRKH